VLLNIDFISVLWMCNSCCIREVVQSVGHGTCLFINWATCLKRLRTPAIGKQDLMVKLVIRCKMKTIFVCFAKHKNVYVLEVNHLRWHRHKAREQSITSNRIDPKTLYDRLWHHYVWWKSVYIKMKQLNIQLVKYDRANFAGQKSLSYTRIKQNLNC